MGKLNQIFSDINGGLSSKRLMLFVSFGIMVAIAYVSIFMNKPVEPFIFDGFLYIVVGSLFSVASEKFSQKFGQGQSADASTDNYRSPDGL